MRLGVRLGALLGLLVVVALVVVGCGGGGSSSGSSSSEAANSGEAVESGETVSAEEEGEASSGSADVSAAEAAIKPYIDQPNPPFPVEEPLKQAPSSSVKFSQLQFGTPFGALIGEITAHAAEVAGVQIQTAKAGSTASSVQSAAQTMIGQSPDAVLLPAAEPQTFADQLEEMDQKGIKVYSEGIMEPEKYGIDGAVFDQRQTTLAGSLLADWVVAKKGGEANVVFYETPELGFSSVEKEGFEAELNKICPECSFRTAVISAEEIGSTAPNTVVSDLQANPDTEVAVFASQEADTGLPAALKAADIEVGIVGFAGDPATLEYIKNGEVEATLGLDVPVQTWTEVDMALRGAAGQPLTPGEKKGIVPMQFLTQKDITFDPSKGWTGYPEFEERFEKLWKVDH